MVQQFVDTRRSEVLLILNEDELDYENQEAFETAVSVIASIGRQVIQEGQDRTVVSGHRTLKSGTIPGLLDELASVTSDPEGRALSGSVVEGLGQAHDASLVVIVTGGPESIPGAITAARRFSRTTRTVVISVGAGTSGVRRVENMLLFSVSSLSELTSVMNVVVSA